MKLGDLFKSLATKAGVDISDLAKKNAEFAGLLTLAVEVPDDVATQIETSLLTLESAKSNGALKSHFFAQLADGFDATLEKIAKKRNLPDDVWATLKGEKSSIKRMELLEDKLLELRDAKDNATSKTEKGQLQKQIEDLQAELRTTKEGHTTALEAERQNFSKKELDLTIEAMLAGKNFVNKELPKNVNIITAKTLINQALASGELQAVKKDGVIRILKQDGADFYDPQHKKVDADGFFDSVLSSNKMLAVTDPAKPGDTNNQQRTTVHNDDRKVNTRMLENNDASLKALSTGYAG